jgi:hypothetical protein
VPHWVFLNSLLSGRVSPLKTIGRAEQKDKGRKDRSIRKFLIVDSVIVD